MPDQLDHALFALNRFAVLVKKEAGLTLERLLAARIESALRNYEEQFGEWEVVWGPAVEQRQAVLFAVNTLFLAKQVSGGPPRLPGVDRYVLSMAGSNDVAIFDWLVENLQVGITVPWKFSKNRQTGENRARGARIALGTWVGLDIQRNQRPGAKRPGAGRTIREQLARIMERGRPIELWMTGHSLGGSVGSALAQYLIDTRDRWDPERLATVGLHTTAGPSAGNYKFARHVSASIPGDRMRRWANTYDVSIHAWLRHRLRGLEELYVPHVEPSGWVRSIVFAARQLPGFNAYSQPGRARPVPRKFRHDVSPEHLKPFRRFIKQVGWQHQYRYPEFFGFHYDPRRHGGGPKLTDHGGFESLGVGGFESGRALGASADPGDEEAFLDEHGAGLRRVAERIGYGVAQDPELWERLSEVPEEEQTTSIPLGNRVFTEAEDSTPESVRLKEVRIGGFETVGGFESLGGGFESPAAELDAQDVEDLALSLMDED